jgi:homospermidine synthase
MSELINIKSKKILMLGYGGVAKCVLNYFSMYFQVNYNNITLVDKCTTAFYGPLLEKIPKKNIMYYDINCTNFDSLIKIVGLKSGDIIIDLTTGTCTYTILKTCMLEGFYYVNTSIEDSADSFCGTSVDLQQKIVEKIYEECREKTKIRSNILVEFGQNPGLIQHYVLFLLNELNKELHNHSHDDFRKETMKKVINDHKIGTILVSEIDNMVKNNETKMKMNKIYNTWSVGGMLVELFDKVELVCGKDNKYIKPVIPKSNIDFDKMKLLPKLKDQKYDVIFLKNSASECSLNSICPILDKNSNVKFTNYRGNLVQHAETFDLGNYFGKDAPFMGYVYKINKYALKSIKEYFKKADVSTGEDDLMLRINNDCSSFEVMDNINKSKSERLVGHDTVGCTVYCGRDKVDKIYWCGSILSSDDDINPNFTPTIVQVAAGVLSGLSYILEEKNKNHGLYTPCQLDTKYVLQKSAPLLGKLFFTEIPKEDFIGKFEYKVNRFR